MGQEETSSVRVWENRFQTILLSICTAAVLGLFGFLWTMNRDFGAMEERDRQRVEREKEAKDEIKAMRIDVKDLQDRMIRMEANSPAEQLYKEAERRIKKPI